LVCEIKSHYDIYLTANYPSEIDVYVPQKNSEILM